MFTNIALVVLSLASTQAATPPDLTPEEKIRGLSMFWKEASDHFVFFDKVPDLDWDKAYAEHIPRVLATKSKAEYYRELKHFSALLKDGHTFVEAPTDSYSVLSEPAVHMKSFGKRVFIDDVLKSLVEQVPIGAEVVEVEGMPVAEHVEKNILPYVSSSSEHIRWSKAVEEMLIGPRDKPVKITVVTPSGEKKTLSLPRIMNGAYWQSHTFFHRGLPTLSSTEYRDLGHGIAYVAINELYSSKSADEFEAMIPQLEKAKGLIIDLRRNGGGNDAFGHRIVSHFTKGKYKGFAWKTRTVDSYSRAWGKLSLDNPDTPSFQTDWHKEAVKHYTGEVWRVSKPTEHEGKPATKLLMPKVVLTSPSTASAAEDMLIFMDGMPEVTRVGEPTFGSTGMPLIFAMPGGGSARVCTQRITYPDGREFIGIGILPHVRVDVTPEAFFGGKDIVLDKGVQVLKAKIGR